MIVNILKAFLALSLALQTAICGHIFFHEPSAILLKPKDLKPKDLSHGSDFGFSLGHWNGSLIVGAPRSDFIGKVYDCPLKEISADKIPTCTVIELNASMDNYTRDMSPNQNFYLGSSIATTKDYFFTCAPLVTKNVTKPDDTAPKVDAVGSCYIYSNGVSTPYKGPWERYMMDDDINTDHYEGGTGWTTLADEETGYIFIAKSSVAGDINYINTYNPSEMITSITKDMHNSDNKNYFVQYWNVGYAITAGKFFSKETVYAVSLQSKSNTGKIVFIEIINKKYKKNGEILSRKQLNLMGQKVDSVDNSVVGAMFGYSMAAADLNQDKYSELLVGAPLQSEDANELEYGAMHICIGGNIAMLNNRKRRLTIMGAEPRGHFGTTIATSDVDGDNIPEVFVSAPYERSGVVYVLSGFELQTRLMDANSPVIQVSKMRYSQQVTRADVSQLGFSLQVIPDVDGNGCNDVAIGAPGSDSVVVLKTLPTVKVIVTLEATGIHGTIIPIQVSSFTVIACVHITKMTGTSVSGTITVTTEIANAMIKKPSFQVNLSSASTQPRQCENILVEELQPGYEGEYVLKTNVRLDEPTSSEVFDKSRAQLSIYSKTETQLNVMRQCKEGEDCTPKTSLNILWATKPDSASAKGIPRIPSEKNVYQVGSTLSENITVTVENVGMVTTGGRCVVVEEWGAPVSSAASCHSRPEYIECSTVRTLRPKDKSQFVITVDMSKISSSTMQLDVIAKLYENCEQKDKVIKEDNLTIHYQFDEIWKRVELKGVNHDKLITDTELLASQSNDENQKESAFRDNQEFLITNNENVTWEKVNAIIEVENTSFITNISTTEEGCTSDIDKPMIIECYITLEPKTTTKIVVAVQMAGKQIGEAFKNKQEINITSLVKLYKSSPSASEKKIEHTLVTNIRLAEDISFKNKPILIVIVVLIIAFIFLALLAYCFYKNGFFKRDNKKKLNVLRESVRRRSLRLASEKSSRHSQRSISNRDCEDQLDIEVVEDSPFEEVPISSKDDVVLIESTAEVHAEDNNKHKE